MRTLWLPRAVDDLKELRAFIAQEKPIAAQEVAARVLEAVDQLATLPNIGRPGRVAGTRELVVRNTPYVIPYRIRDEAIEILRVYHSARRWPAKL